MMEITVALIKPDAMKNGHMTDILKMIEGSGLIIADMVKGTWSRALVAQFYSEHRSRSFFEDLIEFMTSGPMLAMTLVGTDAVQRWRFIMGATDPKKAAPGTIRNLWGSKNGPIMWNCVHGSDGEKRGRDEMDMIRIAMRRSDSPHHYTTMSIFGDEAVRLVLGAGPRCEKLIILDKKCQLHVGHTGPCRHKDKNSESARMTSGPNIRPRDEDDGG